jgi:choline dehydrogenase-like flavoprotein
MGARKRRCGMQRYDVIIIGAGAGGGTLAHRLAGNALRVGDHLLARLR